MKLAVSWLLERVVMAGVAPTALALALAALAGCSSGGGSSSAPATGQGASTAGTNEQGWAGNYALKDDDKGAQLSITENPFAFTLTVVLNDLSGHNGELDAAPATVSTDDNSATFVSDSDCTIVMTKAGTGIQIAQTGTCDSVGFGAYVDATGLYVRQ